MMSVQDMDGKQNSSRESDKTQVLMSNGTEHCKSTTFRNDSHAEIFVKKLKYLREDDFLCDIKLVTDDGSIVVGHKNVLVAASQYFRKMRMFNEINKNVVNIKGLDSTVLELLIDYIYTGKIVVTEENVQMLLPAANVLQLDYVSVACENFIKIQLHPSNCLGIRAFANLHNCTELFKISEAYIKKHFLEVTKCEQFLSLSFEELTKLISCNDINVPLEENVFECVIKWVKHDLGSRKDLLPKLMKHIRLPLISTPYIIKNVGAEPLLKNSLQCLQNTIEALNFQLHNKEQLFTIPETIQTKPRQAVGLQKVILMFGWVKKMNKCSIECYNPTNNLSRIAPEMRKSRHSAGLALIRDRYVFAVGGDFLCQGSIGTKSVEMLDIASQSSNWVPTTDMIVGRKQLGVGVLNDCIYAVGGTDFFTALNSVEVFELRKWSMVCSMSTKRTRCGVGVGGHDGSKSLKSVERYDPTSNSWAPVAELSVGREGVGIAVLDGVLYAIGGYSDGLYLKSAEAFRPSDGVWSPIADMHFARCFHGVVALNGLLYVMGGTDYVNFVHEVYNPNTNTWSTTSTRSLSTVGDFIWGGVVVNDHHI